MGAFWEASEQVEQGETSLVLLLSLTLTPDPDPFFGQWWIWFKDVASELDIFCPQLVFHPQMLCKWRLNRLKRCEIA